MFAANLGQITLKIPALKNVCQISSKECFVDDGMQRVVVTADGEILADLPRQDFVKAQCVWAIAYYNYNLSYDARFNVSKKLKYPPSMRNFMDFVFM